jgi:GTP cyclohydrolase I
MAHSNPQDMAQNEDEALQRLASLYREVLGLIGEDAGRQGLLETPVRMAKAMKFLTKGYREDPVKILKAALFDENYDQMVLVKDIEVYSMCEHHLLPFFGKAHIAYIPNGRIVGLSKIPRLVDAFARRLQVQERLTTQIRDCIQETLQPQGVAVVIEAQHISRTVFERRNTTRIYIFDILKITLRHEKQ